MKNVVIIPNMLRDTDGTGTKNIIEFLKSRNITVYIDNSLKEYGFDAIYKDTYTLTDIDMVIIMGGDGTMLSESKNYINTDIPILGINYGNVGFLTELEKDDIKGLEEIVNGNYSLEKRPIVKVDHEGKTYYSINEASIHRGSSPKMLDIGIIIENVPMKEFRADGLIVATSSGSTAYSLSAGGPIIDPLVNAFVVTPVCPHDVYIKSVVVDANTEIKIKLNNSEQCTFSIDGNLIAEIKGNHEIVIKKGGYINTVKRTENSFYKKLRKKIFEKEI